MATMNVSRAAVLCLVGLLGAANPSCSDQPPDADSVQVRQALSHNARVLGFEQVSSNPAESDWQASAGTLSSSTEQFTEGERALSVANVSYVELQSSELLPLGAVGPVGSIDVLVPGSGSVPWGHLQVFLESSELGLHNQPLELVSLQDLPLGSFQRLEFPIDAQVASALASPEYSLVVRVAINLPHTTEAVLVDRLSFGQDPVGPGTGGATSGSGGTGGVGTGGSGGTGGTAAGGTGGSSTGGTEGGGTGGAATGGSGTGATSGDGGTGGQVAGTTVDFFFELPLGVDRQEVALATHGSLQVLHLGLHPLPMKDLARTFGRDIAGQLRNTPLVHLGVQSRHYPINLFRMWFH